MAEPAKKIATYEDLYGIPENMTGEIIDGELIVTPRPSFDHSHVTSSIGMKLGPPFARGRGDGPGGWIILFEPEIYLGEHVIVPALPGGESSDSQGDPNRNG